MDPAGTTGAGAGAPHRCARKHPAAGGHDLFGPGDGRQCGHWAQQSGARRTQGTPIEEVTMKRLVKILGLCALSAVIASGCMTVGPDYQVPKAPVMPEYLAYGDPLLDTTALAAPEWWKTAFNDPILDQLVEMALAQNLSLRSAGLRVLQARQQLLIAIGNQYPQQQQLTARPGSRASSAHRPMRSTILASTWPGRPTSGVFQAPDRIGVGHARCQCRRLRRRPGVPGRPGCADLPDHPHHPAAPGGGETKPGTAAGERADHHREVRKRRGRFPGRRPGQDPVLQHPGLGGIAGVVSAAVQELAGDSARPTAVRHEPTARCTAAGADRCARDCRGHAARPDPPPTGHSRRREADGGPERPDRCCGQ